MAIIVIVPGAPSDANSERSRLLRGKSTSVVSLVGKAARGSKRFKCRMRIRGNFQIEKALLHFCRVLQLAHVYKYQTGYMQ